MQRFMRDETGYQKIQGTKPQTLAYALTVRVHCVLYLFEHVYIVWCMFAAEVTAGAPLQPCMLLLLLPLHRN